ncbi:MAG TPA: ADP-forming succinate--CoA ligase subunit beta [Planctomycetota bacterium]|nr:ADP-forming succinate--CoA ligase subunit beta [Planctomycetota bacterium]
MKIHEHQAKAILREFGVAVPEGVVCDGPEAAAEAFRRLGAPLAVVKAQIHAGGRGKGGGVKLVRSADEARDAAKQIMSRPLITHQTGPEGQPVKTLLVEKGSKIAKELYLGIALDRQVGAPVLMASAEGGMDVEEVAAKHPEKILRERVDPLYGLAGYQARRVAKKIGVPQAQLNKAQSFLQALCRAYLAKDCSLAEINPLVLTEDGDLIALDAKMNFDDNGLFRQKAVVEMRDLDEEDASEIEASKWELSYINLDGDIGCLVNGAGLAMATMDTIKFHGGEPANFLDVGGGATKERVAAAFEIILRDPKVKAILVNIFGGILRCTTLADGVINAAKTTRLKVPLIVRLEGTEVEEGREMLRKSGLDIIAATDMADAAKKAVAAAKGVAR